MDFQGRAPASLISLVVLRYCSSAPAAYLRISGIKNNAHRLLGTKQACLFRDKYDYITSTGLSIYGLSADSIKANSSFKAKQSLPYPLLCDTASTLISSLGFKKTPRGTTRGVFAVDKQGKVLLLQPGGPDATVDAVQQLISACNIETHGQIKE